MSDVSENSDVSEILEGSEISNVSNENELQKQLEEYRAAAKEHEKKAKDSMKIFLISGLFTVAIAFVIIAASIAWFASNNNTNAGLASASLNGADFELRSYGKNGVHDDMITKFFSDTIQLFDGNGNSYTTSADSASISWIVSDESNANNYDENDVSFPETDRKRYSLKPGSEGEMTFYIVPAVDGTQSFTLTLSMIPYLAEIDQVTKVITAATEVGNDGDDIQNQHARKYLTGHILFFLENDGDKDDLTLLKENEWTVTIENAVANEEYGYTLYWKWPQVFSEIVLNVDGGNSDRYLNGRTPILTETLRQEVLDDMKENPDKYFYNSLTRAPLKTTDSLISSSIDDIHSKSPKIGGENGYDAQSFVDLSSFYNQADQMIGSRISFVLIELKAVLAERTGINNAGVTMSDD